MNVLSRYLAEHITSTDRVLDLGCGVMNPTDKINCKSILGVDIFKNYLEFIKRDQQVILMKMDETNKFLDESFDIVLALDIVEHLEYPDAIRLIYECKRISRRKAIIFTPNVFEDNKINIEAWGLGHNELQEHKCVVPPGILKEMGFTISDVDFDSKMSLAVWTR